MLNVALFRFVIVIPDAKLQKQKKKKKKKKKKNNEEKKPKKKNLGSTTQLAILYTTVLVYHRYRRCIWQ